MNQPDSRPVPSGSHHHLLPGAPPHHRRHRTAHHSRQAGPVDVSVVRAVVRQAVDELRHEPLPAAVDTADDDSAWKRALAGAERVPADTTVLRRLVEEMAAAGGRMGQTALELAPAYLSGQEAVDKILARYADDVGCAVETIFAVRRYALTGDRRALEGTWL